MHNRVVKKELALPQHTIILLKVYFLLKKLRDVEDASSQSKLQQDVTYVRNGERK